MKRILFITIVFLILILSSCSIYKERDRGKAVVMAVGLDYKSSNGGITLHGTTYNPRTLEGTINDSKEIGGALYSLYKAKDVDSSLIYMLSEGNYESEYHPTSEKIIKKIRSLDLNKNDLFIFYYAGHGWIGNNTPLYMITAEEERGGQLTTLTSDVLLKELDNLECRSVVLLDCCYSGVMNPNNTLSPDSLFTSIEKIFRHDRAYKHDKISVLSATNTKEESGEHPFKTEDNVTEIHGAFTYELLNAIGWKHSNKTTTVFCNDGKEISVNGYISRAKTMTLDEIYERVKNSISNQHPLFYNSKEIIKIIP